MMDAAFRRPSTRPLLASKFRGLQRRTTVKLLLVLTMIAVLYVYDPSVIRSWSWRAQHYSELPRKSWLLPPWQPRQVMEPRLDLERRDGRILIERTASSLTLAGAKHPIHQSGKPVRSGMDCSQGRAGHFSKLSMSTKDDISGSRLVASTSGTLGQGSTTCN